MMKQNAVVNDTILLDNVYLTTPGEEGTYKDNFKTYWELLQVQRQLDLDLQTKQPVGDYATNSGLSGAIATHNTDIHSHISKLDVLEGNKLIKNIEYDSSNGTFTFIKYDNTFFKIDTALEKITVNFDYDAETKELVLILSDSSTLRLPLSDFIVDYVGLESPTIKVDINSGNEVIASIKGGSISLGLLNADLIALIDSKATTAYVDEQLTHKVDIVNGKELSTNDFTNELKSKLEDIQATAQVNKIEKIFLNGVELPINEKNINITVVTDAELQASVIRAEISEKAAHDSALAAEESAYNAGQSEIKSFDYMTQSGQSKVMAESSSLTATEKAYKTSGDAQQTTEDRVATGVDRLAVNNIKDNVIQIRDNFLAQKGSANGLASTNGFNRVIQDAENSLRLDGEGKEYFATAEELNDLTGVVNTKIENMTFNTDGTATTKINGVESNQTIVGLIESLSRDIVTGNLILTFKDGRSITVNMPKDEYVTTGSYFDTETNEIVLIMTSGGEIRIPAASLIDVYTGGSTYETSVDVSNHVVYVNINLDPSANNIMQINENGLYVPKTDLSQYKTKIENDGLYLGINAVAKDSEKSYGKTENQLNVNNAQTANKFTNPMTMNIAGAVEGSVSFDGSSTANISLVHKNSPCVLIPKPELDTDPYVIDTAVIEKAVVVLESVRQLRLDNVTSDMILLVDCYGYEFDTSYLVSQGFIPADMDAWNYVTLQSSNDFYTYTFRYNGVEKIMKRTATIKGGV